MDFATLIAKRFDDPEFEKMVLSVSDSEVNPESVRHKARKKAIQLSSESLRAADNYVEVRHFKKATAKYEETIDLIPDGLYPDMDPGTLEKARLAGDHERASRLYQEFLLPLRKAISTIGELKRGHVPPH